MATLKLTKRAGEGTAASRKLRAAGSVPGVIYGHGETPMSVAVCEREIRVALQHHERVLDVEVDGKPSNVLIKDIQWDVYGLEILHADFMWVNMEEKVDVELEIHAIGTPAGQKDGGVLNVLVDQVKINCPVKNIPEEIKLNVNDLELNGKIVLGDVTLPEGATPVDAADTIICVCNIPTVKTEEEETPEEEGSEE